MAESRLGLNLTLENMAVTQFAGFNFNSMAKLGDTWIGANEDGLFTLLDSNDDAGVDIDAFFKLILSDFGISNQKRIRKVYLGREAEGDLTLYVKDDEGNERNYTVPADVAGQVQSSAMVPVGRDGKGRYWSFKVENTTGCDFGVDMIEIIPVILGRRP